MTLQFILLLAYVLDGAVQVDVTGYADGYSCAESATRLVETGAAAGRVILLAECFPVSRSWGLEL